MTDANRNQLEAALEAVLFTMGAPVSQATLSKAMDLTAEEVEDLVASLSVKYEEEDRGIRVIRIEDSYQLVTKTAYYDVLIKIVSSPVKPVLTDVMIEVLSIIAYKQPVTRAEIERVRGVSSDYAVNRLVEFGLVEEKGRQDSPGRPILFGTTEEFLRRFGLSSPADLPPIDEELLRRVSALEGDGSNKEMEGQMTFPISEDGTLLKEEEALKMTAPADGPITVDV